MSVASNKRRRLKRRHARGEWTYGELHLARSRVDEPALFMSNMARRHDELVIADLTRLAEELGPPRREMIAIVHPDTLARFPVGPPSPHTTGIELIVTEHMKPGAPLLLPKSSVFEPFFPLPRRYR